MNFVTQRVRANMKVSLTCYLVFMLASKCCGQHEEESSEAYFSRFIADLWLEGADVVKIIWRDCSKKVVEVKDVIDHQELFPKFVRCMKRKTLRALDRSLSPDVVPLAAGVSLVRFEIVDRSGNVLPENETSSWSDKEFDESDWRTLALRRMARVLRTHVIKIDFEGNNTLVGAEYRGRRRHHMLTMMMFGIVSIGMVLVPMGFQFLAVLGGKALLLAKMALILASIQSIKKITASPVNYGFYHSFPTPYDPYQKRSREDWLPQDTRTSLSSGSTQDPWEIDAESKIDGINLVQLEEKQQEDSEVVSTVTQKPVTTSSVKQEFDHPIIPVYSDPPSGTIDPPTLIDFTTRPSEVQTDYTLDLPYNRFHF